MAPLRIRTVGVRGLAIPMRLRFEHAAASRNLADPVVVSLESEAPNAAMGYGETLAREYVTGETAASVAETIERELAPRLAELRAESFAEVMEFADALPTFLGGRCIHAALAAVELALIDLAGQVFGRRAADAVDYLELSGFGAPGCLDQARYSGIVVGRSAWKQSLLLRVQRAVRLRDFKIKVAVPGWEDRLRRAHRLLGGAIARGGATLRADANGGWSLEEAIAAIPLLRECGVSALEQPLRREQDEMLPKLVQAGAPDLIADESLVTLDDADRLIKLGVRVLNIRIAKVGGLLPAWRMAHRAIAAGCDVQLGCLVGETSILTAAGIAFLEACPRVRFVEGGFGRILLRDDVCPRCIRWGFAGRMKPRAGVGLGVDVDAGLLHRLEADVSRTIAL